MAFLVAAGASIFVMLQMEKRGYGNGTVMLAMIVVYAVINFLLTGDPTGGFDYDPSETCNGRC
jgi:hypothetical protein